MRKRKIGIMGGTFDPIHNGHVWTAKSIYEMLDLDQVIFIPAFIPPHKQGQNYVAAEHRYAMTALAIEGYPNFSVSDMEIKRNSVSYTFDTISALKEEYPEAELYFIIGADTVHQLPSWYRINELIRLTTFVAADRPGYHNAIDTVVDKLGNISREKIILLDTPDLSISSTEIRSRVKNKESLEELVPLKVEEYIVEHGLYL